MLKKIILISLLVLQSAFAKIETNSIKPIMSEKINNVLMLLKNKQNKQTLQKDISAIFDPAFDYPLMAKLSLGKAQYKKLTASQKLEFAKKFEQRLKKSFFSKLDSYSNEKIEILNIKDVKSRKVLQTKLIGQDKIYPINYKFHNAKEKGWLIYDVDILDISIIQTYRNQFARVLDDGSFKKLLSLLEKTEPDIKK